MTHDLDQVARESSELRTAAEPPRSPKSLWRWGLALLGIVTILVLLAAVQGQSLIEATITGALFVLASLAWDRYRHRR